MSSIKLPPKYYHFEQAWILEELPEDPSLIVKTMFGGVAIYLYGKLVLLLMESQKDLEWRGTLVPTEREHHSSLQKQFPKLSPHPILQKWLYLPLKSTDHEHIMELLIKRIKAKDLRFGVLPQARSKKKKKACRKAKRARPTHKQN